jgi:hypothetical protein
MLSNIYIRMDISASNSIGGLVVKLAVAIRDLVSQMIRPAPGSIPGRCIFAPFWIDGRIDLLGQRYDFSLGFSGVWSWGLGERLLDHGVVYTIVRDLHEVFPFGHARVDRANLCERAAVGRLG